MVVILFLLPSKILGNCFKNIPPLTAYTINIIGSIAGIVVFSIISYFSGGPFIWFPLLLIVSLLIIKFPSQPSWRLIMVLFLILSAYYGLDFKKSYETDSFTSQVIKKVWSPYYQIVAYDVQLKNPLSK